MSRLARRRSAESAELHRQGAKAAARGDAAEANPMLSSPNLPEATGEPAGLWTQRRDAWQQGFDLQRVTVDPRPAHSKR